MSLIGEKLHTKLEDYNKHDEYAVAMILDGCTVGYLPRTISRMLLSCSCFLRDLFPLPPWHEALFQQCKTSAIVSVWSHPPHGHVATRCVLETWCLLM